MRLGERRHDDGVPSGAGGTPDSGIGGNLGHLRSAGQEFLSAGDNAIDRALSTNSEAFNEQTRQGGGE